MWGWLPVGEEYVADRKAFQGEPLNGQVSVLESSNMTPLLVDEATSRSSFKRGYLPFASDQSGRDHLQSRYDPCRSGREQERSAPPRRRARPTLCLHRAQSLPECPLRMSSTRPPESESAPPSPLSCRRPCLPIRTSLPFPPDRTSASSPPRSVSRPLPLRACPCRTPFERIRSIAAHELVVPSLPAFRVSFRPLP
jgi:hypothetical protein